MHQELKDRYDLRTARARARRDGAPFLDEEEAMALAVEAVRDAGVDVIVSGDPDLQDAEVPVPVWSPRTALDRLATD